MDDLDRLQTALEGDLLTPASSCYDAARRPAMARYRDVRPQAVVQCASTRDVARTTYDPGRFFRFPQAI